MDIDVPAHQVVLTMQPGNIESFVSCGGESAPNAYTYFPVWGTFFETTTLTLRHTPQA